jgi:DNA (cytosine-5)-methyltransferase 1
VTTTNLNTRRPVAIDLFAGAGGLSLGFELAGFDVVAAVEYDPVHAATHAYNFPDAPVVCRDVRRVQPAELLAVAREGWQRHHPDEAWDGIVDVVVGGPSCQGFSAMGKQDADDDRNELVSEFVRLVEGVAPRAFVMENVPGILAPQFRPLLDSAIARFEAAGYTICDFETPLDATEFGVPQRRKRVFIVGVSEGLELTPIATSSANATSVAEALAGLPSIEGRTQADGELLEMNDGQAEAYGNATNAYLSQLRNMRPRRASGLDGVLSGYRATEHRKSSIDRFRELEQGATDKVSRTWRLVESQPARTLRAGTGRERGAFSAARPLHPVEPRVITVREAARLHSFPDWFRFHTTNWHGHRQIGNAVPPLMAKAVGEAVMRSIGVARMDRSIRTDVVEIDEILLTMSPVEATKHFDAADDEIPAKRRRSESTIDGEMAPTG